MQLSSGKWQRLRSLTDGEGRFKMLAIDQRGSLRSAIGSSTGRPPDQVADGELAQAKEIITKNLAPYATAVLTDPVYGYPSSHQHLPPRGGLLLAYEETGYEKAGPDDKGRLSSLIEGWSVEKAELAGSDAIKLLLPYQPDAVDEVLEHQQGLVRRVGDECEAAALPFLLELISYPLEETSADTPEFAYRRPKLVARSAAEFSQSQYKVDVLKLEFPADLKWVREFSRGAFDGQERQPVYTLDEVREFCRELDAASAMPWVILSAGVEIEEFLVQVELATEAGASGFLCGRAIWKDVVKLYPSTADMEEWLCTRGAYNFVRANAYAHQALPWHRHRRFAERPASTGSQQS